MLQIICFDVSEAHSTTSTSINLFVPAPFLRLHYAESCNLKGNGGIVNSSLANAYHTAYNLRFKCAAKKGVHLDYARTVAI